MRHRDWGLLLGLVWMLTAAALTGCRDKAEAEPSQAQAASAHTSGAEAGDKCVGDGASEDEQAPRAEPPLTKEELVKFCAQSAVDTRMIFPLVHGHKEVIHGAGTILHEDGYILTCAHALRGTGRLQVRLHDNTWHSFRIVTEARDYDVGIIKIEVGKPLTPARLAHDEDVRVGEPVVVFGNPHGRAGTVSHGHVSKLKGGERHIQYEVKKATIAPGHSGGPVFDSRGRMIGMMQIKELMRKDLSYVVKIDHVRKAFKKVIMDDSRFDYRLGLTVEIDGPARVTNVLADSAAQKAGLRAGDVVRRIATMRIGTGMDYCLAMAGRLTPESFALVFERDGKAQTVTVTPRGPRMRPPADVQPDRLVAGLRRAKYAGTWRALPDFRDLTPESMSIVPTIALDTDADRRTDHFALKFTGYLKVPTDGKYAFALSSDDGARLWIGKRRAINNDGLHLPQERSSALFLKAGLHPITVDYFEAAGAEALRVYWQGPGIAKQLIRPQALLTDPLEEPGD